MKKIFENTISKVIASIIVILIVCGAIFGFMKYQSYKKTNEKYKWVITKWEKKTELVVADAEQKGTIKKEFDSDATSEWPDWMDTIKKLFVNRTITIKVPVKTEFKIDLSKVKKSDINITSDNKLTFKNKLIVNVDSQVEGEIKLVKSSTGLVDKTVDLFTSSTKAQEFLTQKSKSAVYDASNNAINNKNTPEKVRKYAEEALEEVLNLSSDEKIDVVLKKSDLKFVNVDPKD